MQFPSFLLVILLYIAKNPLQLIKELASTIPKRFLSSGRSCKYQKSSVPLRLNWIHGN